MKITFKDTIVQQIYDRLLDVEQWQYDDDLQYNIVHQPSGLRLWVDSGMMFLRVRHATKYIGFEDVYKFTIFQKVVLWQRVRQIIKHIKKSKQKPDQKWLKDVGINI